MQKESEMKDRTALKGFLAPSFILAPWGSGPLWGRYRVGMEESPTCYTL